MNNYNDIFNYLDMYTYPNNYNNVNNGLNQNLTDPYTGFIRGNMYSNLYDQYKNYTPKKIKSTNDREELLNEIRKYKFALIDLDLYLDTHPNDIEIINLYNNYLNMVKQEISKYERMYGPLTLSDPNNSNTWEWIKSPWPWEVEK